jgi:hypothetical protein
MSQEISTPTDLEANRNEFRTRVLVIGGILGTVLGVISAVLYLRAAEEAYGDDLPSTPQPRDAMRLGVALLAIIRSITDWGRK